MSRFYRYAKLSNLEEFKENINIGIDQNIFIGDDLFWLGAGKGDTCMIGQCPDGQTEGIYKDAEEMLNNFVFKGKTLLQWINEGAVDYADE